MHLYTLNALHIIYIATAAFVEFFTMCGNAELNSVRIEGNTYKEEEIKQFESFKFYHLVITVV